MAVLVATAGAGFDAEVMGVAIAPAERAAEFRERQQFDRIYAELAQVIDKPHCVGQIACAGLAESQRADVQLVDDEIFQAGGNRQPRREFRRPELLRRDEIGISSRRVRREFPPDHVRVDDHAAADVAVRESPAFRARASSQD